jgi:apolipoprotein N-acyltransferase
VIDDRGRVVEQTRMFHNQTTTVNAITRTGNTIYVAWREWVLCACLGFLVAMLLMTQRMRITARRRAGVASTLGDVTNEFAQ